MHLDAGLAQSTSSIFTTGTIVALVALMIALAALIQVRRLHRRLRSLLDGARGENLEQMLIRHAEQQANTEQRLRDLEKASDNLERRVRTSIRYAGIVRFDAFPDVGGRQSFALALYDEDGNGTVVSSLVGRADSRVYGKALTGGQSNQALSAEEKQAIQEAAYRQAREPQTL